MIENLACLSLIESEMESKSCDERGESNEEHHVWHISVTVGIEGIVSKFITIWFVMSVWLVNNQISVGVWREDVLVTILKRSHEIYKSKLTVTLEGR